MPTGIMQRAFVLSPLNREIWLNQGEVYKQHRVGTEVGGTFEEEEEDDGTIIWCLLHPLKVAGWGRGDRDGSVLP